MGHHVAFHTKETQAVQPRFAIGKYSPRAPCLGALAIADHRRAPSADEPSDVIGLTSLQRVSLQHYAPVCAPSPRCCTPCGSLLWGRLGMVPPLPLNSVTAAFRAVYLSPVGASALGWLGSESHLTRDELWFALQRKKPSSSGSPCGSTFPFKG